MSKEKQIIEEIARDLCESYNDDGTCYCDGKPCDLECENFTDAQYIYIKGYRKQNEPISCGHEKGGEWVKVMNHKECSKCGYNAPYKKIKAGYHLQDLTPFCPNCGAKMKGGAE